MGSHSTMLKNRRRRQRTLKDIRLAAKRSKKQKRSAVAAAPRAA